MSADGVATAHSTPNATGATFRSAAERPDMLPAWLVGNLKRTVVWVVALALAAVAVALVEYGGVPPWLP